MHLFLFHCILFDSHPELSRECYRIEYHDVLCSMTTNDVYTVGFINQKGQFIRNMRIKPIKLPAVISFTQRDYYASYGTEHVYYYDDGLLIPGILVDHKFTPDKTKPTIGMDEYMYTLFSRRIFNLPGRFVNVKK